MDTLSEVGAKRVKTVFSRNEKVMRSSRAWVNLCGEGMHGWDKIFGDRCHSLEIQRLHGVGVSVVVWVSKEGGVGKHQSGEALVPVTEMV